MFIDDSQVHHPVASHVLFQISTRTKVILGRNGTGSITGCFVPQQPPLLFMFAVYGALAKPLIQSSKCARKKPSRAGFIVMRGV